MVSMKTVSLCTTFLLCFSVLSSAQTVAPSNSTQDVLPATDSPRFWVNTTDIGFLVAPLSFYAQMPHDKFLSIDISANLQNVGTSNANSLSGMTFSYISCDPQDYPGNIGANDVVRIVATSQQVQTSIILYSRRSNHCSADDLRSIPYVTGVFTTVDPTVASNVQRQLASLPDPPRARMLPDRTSDTDRTNNGSGWGGGTPSGTTAVAMIVLYTITGIITALFIIIIITGAVRAHRHPERYGPRNIAGRPRQSRAKGIARAMLETLPIVKFGDHDDLPKNKTESDVEMQGTKSINSAADESTETTADKAAISESEGTDVTAAGAANPDGTDVNGHLGCSICTEDFTKGEEVRVLPCNHKFHPECVDPWLLNVSGTCPLCRIDLRPKEEQRRNSTSRGPFDVATSAADSSGERRVSILDAPFAPPLGPLPSRFSRHSIITRRDTLNTLRQTASGTREERIAALRRFRQQRRTRNSVVEGEIHDEEEQRGLTTRLRERFRIRTRRQGDEPASTSGPQPESSSGQSSTQAEQQPGVRAPAPTWTT